MQMEKSGFPNVVQFWFEQLWLLLAVPIFQAKIAPKIKFLSEATHLRNWDFMELLHFISIFSLLKKSTMLIFHASAFVPTLYVISCRGLL